MKTLKINQLEKNALMTCQLSEVIGGRYCSCSCYWADKGGASIEMNQGANYDGGPDGLISKEGNNAI